MEYIRYKVFKRYGDLSRDWIEKFEYEYYVRGVVGSRVFPNLGQKRDDIQNKFYKKSL